MLSPVEQVLQAEISETCHIGEIAIRRTAAGGFVLCHRDDELNQAAQIFRDPDDAAEIAKHDDAGNYRALKTAPNLRRGWQLEIVDLPMLRRALEYFYPGRLAMLSAWKHDRLATTPLRATLNRQSGMYRVAAKISDEQIDHLVGGFCRSDGGCLRTILWRRDAQGTVASSKLPEAKFDPVYDQTGRGGRAIPLLCQEACPLLVNEARKVVKNE